MDRYDPQSDQRNESEADCHRFDALKFRGLIAFKKVGDKTHSCPSLALPTNRRSMLHVCCQPLGTTGHSDPLPSRVSTSCSLLLTSATGSLQRPLGYQSKVRKEDLCTSHKQGKNNDLRVSQGISGISVQGR